MTEEILLRRNQMLIRRLRLQPGESMPWHHDPYHRVTIVLSGDALTIEYRDGNPAERVSISPGQVDWDEPTDRVHRGVNAGRLPYQEIAVFSLDRADADPQPRAIDADDPARNYSAPTSADVGESHGQDVVGVSSVARDGHGRILLIRTAKAGWELPGGQLERGEDLLGALVREVREEAGCEIEVERLTGVTLNTGLPRITIFTFLCRHLLGEPSPGDDSIDAGWFTPDVAMGLVTHPIEQLRLSDALGNDHGIVYRTYRRVPGEDTQRDTFDMLHVLHR